MYETGHFATLWQAMARRWGVQVEFVPGDWRHGVDPAHVEARLAEDRNHAIRAVMVVHNETSTGTTSRIPEIRKAMEDRKSTRLNSSHRCISYAVFCLKKKNKRK